MRDITKNINLTIEEKEYTFQIRKMTALTGTVVVKAVLEKLLPVYQQIRGLVSAVAETDEKSKDSVVADSMGDTVLMISKMSESIGEDELIDLMKKCLRTVSVMLPAGWQPVMVGDNFGFPVLEYDMFGCLRLCFEVLKYNTESFFGGENLLSVLNRLSTQSPTAKT